MRPIIGILGNTLKTEPKLFQSIEREYVNTDYIKAVDRNGGAPVVLPSEIRRDDPARVMSIVDGLLVPGGEDVNPFLYHEEPETKCGGVRPEIDEAWVNAIRYALDNRIPMLGICKGIQLINVILGGTLYQDISNIRGEHVKHLQSYERSYLTHHVELDPKSRLYQILGEQGEVETNSMHHQAVKSLGKGLRISGRAKDGVIEAAEDEEGLIQAVQWHPEGLIETNPLMNRLFQDLVARASGITSF